MNDNTKMNFKTLENKRKSVTSKGSAPEIVKGFVLE